METEGAMVRLASKEGTVFEVPMDVAKMSQLVMDTLGNDDEDDDSQEANPQEDAEVPLPNVSALVLEKVVDFCNHYCLEEEMMAIQTPLKSNKLDELVQPWYASFVDIDRNVLFDLVAAANFMDIKPLLDLTCLAVSILIKGKSAQELREMFNISAEFSAEEEAAQQRENQWVENQAAAQNGAHGPAPNNP